MVRGHLIGPIGGLTLSRTARGCESVELSKSVKLGESVALSEGCEAELKSGAEKRKGLLSSQLEMFKYLRLTALGKWLPKIPIPCNSKPSTFRLTITHRSVI